MILNSIIRALLENNSVSVTGLGNFSVVHIPSHIKEDIVFPPRNLIEFEHSKEIIGFDFVNKISEWNQIRMDEAQNELNQWVELIENGLEHNKTLFFDNFGTFTKDNSGKIVFQSAVNPQLNIENEGYEPVIMPQKTSIDFKENKEKPIKDKREIIVRKRKKRDRIIFFITISVAAVLMCVLFLKKPFINLYEKIIIKKQSELFVENFEEDTTSCISQLAIAEEVAPENYVESSTEDELKEDNEKAEQPSFLSSNNDLYLTYQKGYFYVIAGSFVKEESALLHIKQKKLDQYHAKLIIHPQSNRIRVCIGVFDNEQEAIHIATMLDENYWVLK